MMLYDESEHVWKDCPRDLWFGPLSKYLHKQYKRNAYGWFLPSDIRWSQASKWQAQNIKTKCVEIAFTISKQTLAKKILKGQTVSKACANGQ